MEGFDFSHVDGIVITGTTNSTADTTMATKPTNPYSRADCYAVVLSGAGVYIEDSGASTTNVSGITATSIDIRSTNVDEPFKVMVIPRPVRVRTGTFGGVA